MPDDTDANTCPPSTTWSWKTVRIRTPPQATSTARRSRSPLASLPPYPPREALMFKIEWRGGPEGWWQLTARGKTVRRPGALALHDVLREFWRLD